MPVITVEDAAAAYSAAKLVLRGELSRTEAIDALEAERGMGRGSAADYINVLRCMIGGRQYTRTLNSSATELYLELILADYGMEGARQALKSARSHVDYYDTLGHGRLASIRRICDDFAVQLDFLETGEQAWFDRGLAASRRLPPRERAIAMSKFPVKPATVTISTTVFRRNPHVVVAVLERAKGVCEMCSQPAPFIRSSSGQPYLEVHHTVTLAAGGDDTVENAIAVCPNCHREAHFG